MTKHNPNSCRMTLRPTAARDWLPAWVSDDISPHDVAAIAQGGCASGAYMPAVIYSQANDVMSQHGDCVLYYIEEQTGELPTIPKEFSWSGIAVFFLSYAVELWASSVADILESSPEADDETETDAE